MNESMTNPMKKKLSLSWDSYKTSISHGLGLLQQRGEFVDMTLAADGHHVKVHQIVLSLVSPFIKDLITSTNCPHPVIFLNKISCDTLQSILEYVYTGEVMVTPEKLAAFLEACKELHIKGLQDITIQGDSNNLLQLIGARNSKNSEDPLDFPETLPVEIISRAGIKRRRVAKKEVPIEYIFSDDQTHDDEANHDKTNDGDETDYDDEADDGDGDDCDDETHGSEDEKHAGDETHDGDKAHDDETHSIGLHNDGMEDECVEIAPYKAGSRWVCRGAHYYMVQRVKGQTTYLRCANDKTCPAHWKLLKKKGAGPVIGSHNHEPTPWVPSRNAMFQALKRRASSENIRLTAIYAQEAARYQDAASHLPFESVAPSMRKWRRSAKPIIS